MFLLPTLFPTYFDALFIYVCTNYSVRLWVILQTYCALMIIKGVVSDFPNFFLSPVHCNYFISYIFTFFEEYVSSV